MVVATEKQMQAWNPMLYPADSKGAPALNLNEPMSPSDPADFDNFIVALPTGQGRDSIHSEQRMLPYTKELLNRFRERSGTPAAIILYSKLAPCYYKCIDLIVEQWGAADLNNIRKVVVYSNWQDSRDVSRGEDVFDDYYIEFYRVKESDLCR